MMMMMMPHYIPPLRSLNAFPPPPFDSSYDLSGGEVAHTVRSGAKPQPKTILVPIQLTKSTLVKIKPTFQDMVSNDRFTIKIILKYFIGVIVKLAFTN
jgi:hypothetical protein